MVLKLYGVSDGPPSISVRQALTILEIPFELINVDYGQGEHMTFEYAKMNPQKEIPVLDDDGFYLSESNAILQYICDKYKPGSDLYPKDPKARAIVNHRLCFNLSTYYANISAYTVSEVCQFALAQRDGLWPITLRPALRSELLMADDEEPQIKSQWMAPVFYDYERTELGLKKVHMALDVLETYFERQGTSYAAANHLTIADFPLLNTNMTLEAIGFDFSNYKKISKWYNDFKKYYPELWKISEGAMKEVQYFIENPPDLTHLNHPIHPARKINK